MVKHLISLTGCPVAKCPWSFSTKHGFLNHMKTKHGFTKEELAWPRRFLKEKVV